MQDRECDLSDRVVDALLRSSFVDSRWIRPVVRDGVVILKGILPTFYQKQMAQEQLRDVEGVAQIYNDIRVERRGQSDLVARGQYVNEWTIEPATVPLAPTSTQPADREVA